MERCASTRYAATQLQGNRHARHRRISDLKCRSEKRFQFCNASGEACDVTIDESVALAMAYAVLYYRLSVGEPAEETGMETIKTVRLGAERTECSKCHRVVLRGEVVVRRERRAETYRERRNAGKRGEVSWYYHPACHGAAVSS